MVGAKLGGVLQLSGLMAEFVQLLLDGAAI